ncbi:MAG: flagellar basal body-associated FliL family protein [Armatimonadota bacterium]
MNKMFSIVLVAVALAAGAGGTFFYLKNGNKAEAHPVKVEQPTEIIELDELTLNLADKPQPHYVKAKFALAVSSSKKGKVEEFAKEHKPIFMDRIIAVLSKHTLQSLLSPEGKTSLKEELLKEFNAKLKDSGWEVKEVLLTDFVME